MISKIKSKGFKRRFALVILFSLICAVVLCTIGFAEDDVIIPSLELNFGQGSDNTATSIQILLLITVLSMAPSILIMMTTFTRFIIVFSFLRKAISLQSTPPNQVLVALSLFMTFFIMSPVINEVVTDAYQPLVDQEITQREAIDRAIDPIKEFMLRQVRTDDLKLFIDMSTFQQNEEDLDSSDETFADESNVDGYEFDNLPITTLIPAFLISEIKTGFQIGFLLFIPFIVIDMVVASTLMSLGMMMLPPVMISLPFKILLFIMVDGWHLLVEQLIRTVR